MEVTEGTPLTQNMVEETPVIRTTPSIKTESLVKEITINKPTPFTGDRTRVRGFIQECLGYLH